ncbi:hypothetical protein Tco_0310987, partial [Tanacetum coccineum]
MSRGCDDGGDGCDDGGGGCGGAAAGMVGDGYGSRRVELEIQRLEVVEGDDGDVGCEQWCCSGAWDGDGGSGVMMVVELW